MFGYDSLLELLGRPAMDCIALHDRDRLRHRPWPQPHIRDYSRALQQVDITSQVGHGTTVTLRLPGAPAAGGSPVRSV